MMKHKPQRLNKFRGFLLKRSRSRQMNDGLNSVRYKIVNITLYTGFTHILLDIGSILDKKNKRFLSN